MPPEGSEEEPERGCRCAGRTRDGMNDAAPVSGRDVLAPRPGLFVQETGGERVLVPVEAEVADLTRVWTLSPTAAAIWDLLDGARPVDAVVEDLQRRYEAPEARIRAEVLDLLGRLLREGLLRRCG